MNVHERELLRQIKQGPLPMNLHHQAGIEAARVLRGLGYIDATVEAQSTKATLVIVSGVTSLGEQAAQQHA